MAARKRITTGCKRYTVGAARGRVGFGLGSPVVHVGARDYVGSPGWLPYGMSECGRKAGKRKCKITVCRRGKTKVAWGRDGYAFPLKRIPKSGVFYRVKRR